MFPVIAKHRPHASPAPDPGADPKVSWLTAAVNPLADFPHAAHSIKYHTLTTLSTWSLTGAAAASIHRERSGTGWVLDIAASCSLLRNGESTGTAGEGYQTEASKLDHGYLTHLQFAGGIIYCTMRNIAGLNQANGA